MIEEEKITYRGYELDVRYVTYSENKFSLKSDVVVCELILNVNNHTFYGKDSGTNRELAYKDAFLRLEEDLKKTGSGEYLGFYEKELEKAELEYNQAKHGQSVAKMILGE